MKRPFAFYLLALLLFFLGSNGLIGGGLLMIKPDGSLLGMQKGWLDLIPFASYFIPGLLLFLLNGIIPLLALSGLLLRPDWKLVNRLNIYRNIYWPWTFALYSGIIAIAWIIVQQALTAYFWIQPLITAMGLSIVILALLPGLMKYFEIDTLYEKHQEPQEKNLA